MKEDNLSSLEKIQSITSSSSLITLTLKSSHHIRGDILNTILNNKIEFQRFASSVFGLTSFTKAFPDHTQEILIAILNNEMEFQRLILSIYDLKVLIKIFPNYTQEILTAILSNEAEFQRSILSIYDLKVFIEIFPNHKHKIVEKIVLTKENELKKLIESNYNERNLKSIFEEYKEIYEAINKEQIIENIFLLKSKLLKESRKNIVDATKKINRLINSSDPNYLKRIPCEIVEMIAITSGGGKLTNQEARKIVNTNIMFFKDNQEQVDSEKNLNILKAKVANEANDNLKF